MCSNESWRHEGRVYVYGLAMPRAQFVRFLVAQGLVFDLHRNVLLFPAAQSGDPECIDRLRSDPITKLRVWRRP